MVAPGDTLYSIARRYGTTVDAIKRVNRLSSNIIYVGQVLQIGGGGGAPTGPSGGTVHTVVHGDTLYSIARRYGTSVDALQRANHLSGTNIYVGQRLSIPTSAGPVRAVNRTLDGADHAHGGPGRYAF